MAEQRIRKELEHFMLHNVKHLDSGQEGCVKLEVDGVICKGKVLETLLRIENDAVCERFVQTCQVMSELRHPNIEKFMGVCFMPVSSLPVLVVEHFDSTLGIFVESTPEISLQCKCSVLRDVVLGLAYLHGRTPPIIHGGKLNTRNIFLYPDMKAKISASCLLDVPSGDDNITSSIGHYTASSAEHDVFAFGKMAVHLLHPTNHRVCCTDSLCDDILNVDVGDSHLLMQLLQRCLTEDLDHRPSIQQVVEQLESIESDLVASDGKPHLVQSLTDSEHHQQLNPEMKAIENLPQEVPGDLTDPPKAPSTTEAKSKDGPKDDNADPQSPMQSSTSHISLHSEPIHSSKYEQSFPEAASNSEDSHEIVMDRTSTSSRNSSTSSWEPIAITVTIKPEEDSENEDVSMSEHQAPKCGVYSSLIARRYDLMQEFEKKAERYKELLLQEMQITGIPPQGLTADEIEKMEKKLGVSYKFSKLVMEDSVDSEDGYVDDLERQLEIQSTIIEASKNLLSQTNDRWLKKDRKKGIKQAEKKFLKLEEKLQRRKRSSGLSTSTFYVDLPTQSCRRNSLDLTSPVSSMDSYFGSTMDSCQPSPESNLLKLSRHRSTSALNEMDSSQTQLTSPKHTRVTATQSLIYHAMFAFH